MKYDYYQSRDFNNCYQFKVIISAHRNWWWIINSVICAVFLTTSSVSEREITCRLSRIFYGHVSKRQALLKSTFTSRTLTSSNCYCYFMRNLYWLGQQIYTVSQKLQLAKVGAFFWDTVYNLVVVHENQDVQYRHVVLIKAVTLCWILLV